MTTPRTHQAHQRRVDRIAEQAAAEVAADSPLDEEVIVTVEEVPPKGRETGRPARARNNTALLDGVLSPQQYVETIAAVTDANAEFVQRVLGAQLRFATRVAAAVIPGSR